MVGVIRTRRAVTVEDTEWVPTPGLVRVLFERSDGCAIVRVNVKGETETIWPGCQHGAHCRDCLEWNRDLLQRGVDQLNDMLLGRA